MSVTVDDIRKIANLAHLELDESEIEVYANRFNEVLAYIDQMQAIGDRDDSPGEIPWFAEPTPMRDDQVKPSLGLKRGLRSAPKAFEDFLVVPKVVQNEG